MGAREDFMEPIVKEAFDKAVRQVVEAVFKDRWGYNDQREVTVAIRVAAEEMIRADPEIRDRLKRRLIEIIDRGESRA